MDSNIFREKYGIQPSTWMRVLNEHFFPLHQTGRKRDDPELRRAVETALDQFDRWAEGKVIRYPGKLLVPFIRQAAFTVPPQTPMAADLPGLTLIVAELQDMQRRWETQLGKRLRGPSRDDWEQYADPYPDHENPESGLPNG